MREFASFESRSRRTGLGGQFLDGGGGGQGGGGAGGGGGEGGSLDLKRGWNFT